MTIGLEDPQSLYFHVRILMGFVVGLALTHILRGLAHMLEHPKYKSFHWIHLTWALWMFIYLLHFWWWELRLSIIQKWTFWMMAFLVMYSLLLYLLTALLFPSEVEDHDYENYIRSRGSWFFGLLGLVYVFDFYDTWLKGAEYFHSLGMEYIVRNVIYIVLCGVAMRVKNKTFSGVFAVAALVHQISWIARIYN